MSQTRDGGAGPDPEQGEEVGPTGPVIRDKRRLDPETGQVREPATPQEEHVTDEQSIDLGGETVEVTDIDGGDQPNADAVLAAERLEDLQRLQAEYLNYKRRVERDRERDRAAGTSAVIEALLPVMDDIHSAREHGDLADGPMAAIVDKIETTLGKFGVQRLGAEGDVFDPTVHEALMHLADAEVPEGATETTVVKVVQPGFLVGDRLVRPARVAVADPPAAPASESAATDN